LNVFIVVALGLALFGTLTGISALRLIKRSGTEREKRRMWLTEIGATAFMLLLPLAMLERSHWVSETVTVGLFTAVFVAGLVCMIASERI